MEHVPDTSHAPGCFGSAMTFSEDAAECRGCIFASKCAPLSNERRQAMRARLGLDPEPTPKRTVRARGAEMTGGLPKKVAALLERFEQAGIKITDALRANRNPFEEHRPVFMRLTCHLLLRLPDGFSRMNLMTAFQRKLNWSEGTASAHVSQAIAVLTALDLIENLNGTIKLKR